MNDTERLLRLEPDGHAGDPTLAALVDGEDEIVDPEARAHVAICEACTARLGEAALAMLEAREAVIEVQAAARRRVPARLVLLGLGVAGAAAAPALVAGVRDLADQGPTLAAVLARTASRLAVRAEIPPVASGGAALVLALLAFALLRLALSPREAPSLPNGAPASPRSAPPSK
jgi:hypothetical protein